MLNCKQVSQIVTESVGRKLGVWTRMQLWMHLGMCGLCSRFRKAIIRIDKEARLLAQEIEADRTGLNIKLSTPARDRIRRALDPGD